MLRRVALRALHTLRWLTAAFLAATLTLLAMSWMVGRGAREVIDSRKFWVAWVQDSGLAPRVRAAMRTATGALEAHGREVLGARSPRADAAVREAISGVQDELDRHLARQIGESLDSVIGYLSARDAAPLDLDLGLEEALARASNKAAVAVASSLCERVAGTGDDLAGAVTSGACDQAASAAALAASGRFSTWLRSSQVVSRLNGALLETVLGLQQVRSAALAVRGALHVLGMAVLCCLGLFVLMAWRLRTVATLLGVNLLFASVILTPFVRVFGWLAPMALGPTAGEIAASAAGLRPLGVGVHLVLAFAGAALLAMRLLGPRRRARFWEARLEHEDPWVRAQAQRSSTAPAGLREPEYVLRALLAPRR